MKLTYAGIFLIAGSVLLLEIALTRVFAVMMWHHLAYMVVSVALLGFGAAGSLITARGRTRPESFPDARLALLGVAYGVSVMLAFFAATRVPVDTLEIWSDTWNLGRLALLYGIVTVPFFLGGLVIGLLLTHLARFVGRLYFSDLFGSAVAGLASVFLLARFGSSASVAFAATIGVAGGAILALSVSRKLFWTTLPVLGGALLLCLAFTGGSERLSIPALDWPIPYAPGKEFARIPSLAEHVRLHSSTAEIEVGPSQTLPPLMAGNFGRSNLRTVEGRIVGQDGTAPTMLYQGAADLDSFAFLDDNQAGSAYVALRARGGSAPRVLVIGVGGGIDVMIALAHGAERVTTVEINRAMIRAVTDLYDDYLGGLFRPGAHAFSDRIHLVHRDGRSFVRASPERYDVIQLSGVDSFTALSTGAYTLAESYLYTTDAVKDFYAHLDEGGYLNYSRFMMTRPKKPRETLRLAHIARQALTELGVSDPAAQILVLQGTTWASTIVKRGPFTRAEVEALRRFGEQHRFWGLVYDPLHPYRAPFEASPQPWARAGFRVATALGLRGSSAASDEVLGAVWGAVAGRKLQESASTDGAGDAISSDIVQHLSRTTDLSAAASQAVRGGVDLALGLESGFWQTRHDFETLIRGSDAERQAFVADYDYDVSPISDDRPFFFNYYRYAALFRSGPAETSPTDAYHPDFPVGHVVLLASLVQITLLAALLILLPLRFVPAAATTAPGRWRVFAYFASLGIGFMFAEISLMQKLVLFLGHPSYAISVVLTTLLGFAGLGALLAARVPPAATTLRVLAGLILAVLLLTALATNQLLPVFLAWELPARVALVVVLMAPLGLVLGIPFPLGIRILDARAGELVPWAWAINGFLSVFAGILTIVLAMAIGFSWVLVIAALVYVLGMLAMAGSFGKNMSPGPSA